MAIKAIAMDVDGVLTDGTVWLDEQGRETKRISFADVMGVSIGRRAGLRFALISGESGGPLSAIAAKFGIETVYAGCTDKAEAIRDFADQQGLELAEVCYIGDDVNDIVALSICGMAVTPFGAHAAAVAVADMTTSKPGGMGAARELIDHVLGETGVSAGPTGVPSGADATSSDSHP